MLTAAAERLGRIFSLSSRQFDRQCHDVLGAALHADQRIDCMEMVRAGMRLGAKITSTPATVTHDKDRVTECLRQITTKGELMADCPSNWIISAGSHHNRSHQ